MVNKLAVAHVEVYGIVDIDSFYFNGAGNNEIYGNYIRYDIALRVIVQLVIRRFASELVEI